MRDRKNSFYARWADKDKPPHGSLLNKWTLEGWQERKAKDQLCVISDINHTLSFGEDDLLRTLLNIEQNALSHMRKSWTAALPVLDYVPKRVDSIWVQARRQEIHRQREAFSTFAYWKDPEPDLHSLNSMATILNNQITRYDRMASEDWVGPMEALQLYVAELEALQMLLNAGRTSNSDVFATKRAWDTAKELNLVHKTLLFEVTDRGLSVAIHPWVKDWGVTVMTWEEFEDTPIAKWGVGSGLIPECPIFSDGPFVEEARDVESIEALANMRREVIDEHLKEWRHKRYVLVQGFLRRERKVWGRSLMAIAQEKRWAKEE